MTQKDNIWILNFMVSLLCMAVFILSVANVPDLHQKADNNKIMGYNYYQEYKKDITPLQKRVNLISDLREQDVRRNVVY